MRDTAIPSPDNQYLAAHAALLINSYYKWTGLQLVPDDLSLEEQAQYLYQADFALVSHGTQSDPIFNYANQTALQLFEMDWHTITRLPSRQSAEPVNRQEREILMQRVTRDGYIDDYSGVRISANGKRFMIKQATVWNLLDEKEQYRGQAAVFSHWIYL